ncbi:hypothetical protein BDW71DRAFT_199881 [Aspergillus fruticulosus]
MQKTREKYLTIFLCLFIFIYLRLLVHLIAYRCLYKPAPIAAKPTLSPSDCTVILSTLDPANPDFEECLTSCLANEPAVLVIVTVGGDHIKTTNRIVALFQTRFPNTRISVKTTAVPDKRSQIAQGLEYFLPTILAPFEDSRVGIVGTSTRTFTIHGFDLKSFWNMLGALDLKRQNFVSRATNAIDGGVGVVPGPTTAHRSSILTDPMSLEEFMNKRFFFGKVGPLNADEDTFITRWNIRHGYKIKIQHSEDAMTEIAHTTHTYQDCLSHSLHRERMSWRSPFASLTDRTVWTRRPWSIYAIYLTSFIGFAFFYDIALVYTLTKSILGQKQGTLAALLLAILFYNILEPGPYFLCESRGLLMLPGYLLFYYARSLVKLFALFTFWVTGYRDRVVDSGTLSPGSVPNPRPLPDPDPPAPAPTPTAAPAAALASLPRRIPTHHYTPAGRQTEAPIPESPSQPQYAASSPVLRREKRSITRTETLTSRSGQAEG